MTFGLLVAVLAPILVALVIGLARPGRSGRGSWAAATTDFVTTRRAALIAALGRAGTFAMLTLAGAAAAVAVLWLIGAGVVRLTQQVDAPLYAGLTEQYFGPDSEWTRLMQRVTQLGDVPWQSLAVVIVGGVVVGLGWSRRRWVPTFALFTTLVLEWFSQRAVASVIDRGTPPFGNGTYPSGGSARVVALYGMIAFLAIVAWPRLGRRWRVALWSAVAVLAAVEGYSRLYLLKHWPADVPAGWLLGLLLLVVMMVSTPALGGPVATGPAKTDGSTPSA